MAITAEEEEEEPIHIYEARDEKMVSFKERITKWRVARFLLPLAKNVKEAIFIPHTTLLLSDILPHSSKPPNVICKGWNSPQLKWKQWVLQLAPKYQAIWIKAGIYEAIFSSTYEVRFNQEIVLGLSEFWCTETNTFVFPWGEATITLEDVMILGGYSLLGEGLSSDLTEELEKIVRKMEKFRGDLLKSKSKKADHASWLKQFMEEDNDIGHVAFLSLWLTRYVFPSRIKETVESNVFPIAARLSKGVKLALGPAILANLYVKLREFSKVALESLMEETILVPGQFQLMQVWAFERFPALSMGLKGPNMIEPGEPRMARWHRVNFKLNMPLVRSALMLAENFEWRPYAADLENWQHRPFYNESEQLVFDCLSLDEELQSYVRSLRVSELVGIDGRTEKYLPNRVAMQFGMDQDLPSDMLNFNCTSEIVSVYVPSRSFQPGVSVRYSNWWKDSMITREGVIKDVLSQKNKKDLNTSFFQENGIRDECDTVSDDLRVAKENVHASQARKRKTSQEVEVPIRLKNMTKSKSSSGISKEAVKEKSRNPMKSMLNDKKDVCDDSSGDEDLLLSQVCKRRTSQKVAVPVGLKNMANPKSSTGISKEAVKEKSHNPMNKSMLNDKKYVNVDSSGDEYVISSQACKRKTSPKVVVPVGLKNVANPKSSSGISKEGVKEKSHNPMNKSTLNDKKDVFEDSTSDDEDLHPICSIFKVAAGLQKRSCNLKIEVDSSTSCLHEKVEKENSSATNKKDSPEKVTFSPIANEIQSKKVGGSMNPISIDDDSDNSADKDYYIRSSKHEKDLEGRIKKLEEMLGVRQG